MSTLNEELGRFGDEITYCTLSYGEMSAELDGYRKDYDFLAWSREYVYFLVGYDGDIYVRRAARNPRKKGQPVVGGEFQPWEIDEKTGRYFNADDNRCMEMYRMYD